MSMLNIILLLFLFKSLIKISYQMKNLWIIRHCDKNTFDPCCSFEGIERSNHWINFFEKYINFNSNVKIYTSKFNLYNLKKICFPVKINDHSNMSKLFFQVDKNCQKSQRMYISANILSSLIYQKYNKNITLDSEYCVGKISKLFEKIQLDITNSKISDGILIWEHKEIIDLIRLFGLKLSKWNNNLSDQFQIVFKINFEFHKPILYYDCYDYKINNIGCESKINSWLEKYSRVSIDNSILTFANKQNIQYNIQSIYTKYFLIILILFLMLICLIWYWINRILLNLKRHGYVEIL